MKEIAIILLSATLFENSKDVAERLKGKTFENITALHKWLKPRLKKEDEEDEALIQIFNMDSFVDGVNNQEIDNLTDSFIASIIITL